MIITQIWFNCVYLLYGAWNENAKISSQNSSFSPIAESPVNFWSTGLCCRSLMDEGLAPISSQTSFNADFQSAFSRLELLFESATNSSKVIRWQDTRVRLPCVCQSLQSLCLQGLDRYQGLFDVFEWSRCTKLMGNKQASQQEPVKRSPHSESLSRLFEV